MLRENRVLWYALRIRAGHEKASAHALRCRGLEEFLPVYTSVRRWSDRSKEIEMPLFPGYVFCRFDLAERVSVLTTQGVREIVGIGRDPYAVDENEINVLQTVVKSGLLRQPWPFLKVGEHVIIREGPLRNINGILAEIRGDHKLIVSITLLQRSVAVSVERAWVKPLAPQDT